MISLDSPIWKELGSAGWEMKTRSVFCLLHTERASAPTAEKERLTGIGWRSSSDMDGAADDMLLGATDDSFPDAGFSSISIRME